MSYPRCRRIVVVFVLLFLEACAAQPRQGQDASAQGNNDDLPLEFARVLRDYEHGWSNKDAPALAALFAEDGFVLPNGHPPVRGRANIQKHYTGAGGPLHLRALAWAKNGGIGYIIGEYAHNPEFTNPGKFTLTLTRNDAGRWLIMSDMDNGNSRPR